MVGQKERKRKRKSRKRPCVLFCREKFRKGKQETDNGTPDPPLTIVGFQHRNIKDGVAGRHSPGSNGSSAKLSGSQEHPPQYGRLTGGRRGGEGEERAAGKGTRAQEETLFPSPALKAPAPSPPLCVSACAPASPAWSCFVRRKTLHSFSSGT